MANFPFRNVNKIHQPLISDNIESNLAAYLQWNLLGVSAFGNVSYTTTDSEGVLVSRLRPATHENYTNGKVWESFRKQWIWQNSIYNSVQPTQVSGIKVNGTFYGSATTGAYAHTIDYPNGRVIFNNAISTTATVLAEYSYNYFQIYTSDNPWWSTIQRNSFRVDDTSFLTSASGFWSKPPEQRIQLPAIIIEATTNVTKSPYNLGNHQHWHKQEVKMYVVTETRQDIKWMTDVLTGQYDGVLDMFDKSQMIVSGVYPINIADGSLSSSVYNYPDLLSNFPLHKQIQFKDVRTFDNSQYIQDILDKRTIPFYYAIVRTQLETLLN